jgi:hypothetical protein
MTIRYIVRRMAATQSFGVFLKVGCVPEILVSSHGTRYAANKAARKAAQQTIDIYRAQSR